MQAINISNQRVTIKRAVKKAVPAGPGKLDTEIQLYEDVVFEPGEIREMGGYAKPRHPLSTVEMLSGGSAKGEIVAKVVPIGHEKAREYLAKLGKAVPDVVDKFAVREEPTITSSELTDKLAELDAKNEERVRYLEGLLDELLTERESEQAKKEIPEKVQGADQNSKSSERAPAPSQPASQSKPKGPPSNGGRKRGK